MEEKHVIQRTPRRPKTTVINLAKVGCYKLKQKKGVLRAPKKTDFEIYRSTCSKRMPNIDVAMEGICQTEAYFQKGMICTHFAIKDMR